MKKVVIILMCFIIAFCAAYYITVQKERKAIDLRPDAKYLSQDYTAFENTIRSLSKTEVERVLSTMDKRPVRWTGKVNAVSDTTMTMDCGNHYIFWAEIPKGYNVNVGDTLVLEGPVEGGITTISGHMQMQWKILGPTIIKLYRNSFSGGNDGR